METQSANVAGEYITFRVAQHHFAMLTGQVRGIVPLQEMVPAGQKTSLDPPCLIGFTSLGGHDLPVIDLACKLELTRSSGGREPCILVVESQTPEGPRLAGFIADRISEVLRVRARDFRLGKLRIGRPRTVLDADQVLAR